MIDWGFLVDEAIEENQDKKTDSKRL